VVRRATRHLAGVARQLYEPTGSRNLQDMALEMRPQCERCQAGLGHDDLAFICSQECTFCPACTMQLGQRCPNCGGELARRPRR
jgi:hypothetical protein